MLEGEKTSKHYISSFFLSSVSLWDLTLQFLPCLKISNLRDFSGGPVVKNPPSNAGDTGLIPGRGTKIPHAMGQLSLRAVTTEPACSGARVPQLESPCATIREPVCHNYWARALWSQRATSREPMCCNYWAHALWSLRATTRERPVRHNQRGAHALQRKIWRAATKILCAATKTRSSQNK